MSLIWFVRYRYIQPHDKSILYTVLINVLLLHELGILKESIYQSLGIAQSMFDKLAG